MENIGHNPDEYITARGLNEVAYCPRLYHLMYVQGLFDDSVDTLEGKAQHSRRRSRGKNSENLEDARETPWSNDKIKDVILSDPDLGITGKFDIVVSKGDATFPIEDKHGPAPHGSYPFHVGPFELPPSAWGNDQMQMGAQIALLRANGYQCEYGKIYYRKSNKLVEIYWSELLYNALIWSVEKARQLHKEAMPEPLIDSQKCLRCSLNHICLPDEIQYLKGNIEEPRRLHPGRSDRGILYLTTPGSYLSKNGENMKVTLPDGRSDHIPIKEIEHVCIFGNTQISTQALSVLVDRGVSISYLTTGGWICAVVTSVLKQNIAVRKAQFLKFSRTDTCLRLAQSIVSAKIANQRTLLRRNRKDNIKNALNELKIFCQKAKTISSLDSLRGIEGISSRIYWEEYHKLLNPPTGTIEMNGRNRRPPQDPVNAMLSYGYTLLLRDFYSAISGVGMDPLYGFYHQLVPGRPSLALDLMEPFRPLIVDSAVLRAVNEGSITQADFLSTQGCCLFKKDAKYKWISAYERRIDKLVTHPSFGYRLSYRRVFYIEARLLSRFIEGEINEYSPLMTR